MLYFKSDNSYLQKLSRYFALLCIGKIITNNFKALTYLNNF